MRAFPTYCARLPRAGARGAAAACAVPRAACLAAALACALALLAGAASPAFAQTIVGPLGIACSVQGQGLEDGASVQVGAFDMAALGVSCDPSEIEVGISCGMEGMCGLDPCLCGSPDAYGACACNGFETVSPQVAVESSDPGVVRVVRMGDSWQLLSMGGGQADVTVSASLPHYEDAACVVHVSVGPASPARLALVFGVPLAVVLAVAAAVAAAVRRRARARSAKGGGRS